LIAASNPISIMGQREHLLSRQLGKKQRITYSNADYISILTGIHT